MNADSKEDGLKLIFEPGYKLQDLHKYISGSCLKERCLFFNASEEIEEICKGFLKLLKEDLSLDEITTLFVVACMIYFVDASPVNMEWRAQLLMKAFCYVDTLNPMHIHVASKRLYEGLKQGEIANALNIVSICNQISVINETGRAIAICLIWALLSEITETEFKMYCFREFSQLVNMLSNIDNDILQMEDSIQVVYILVQCIGFQTNSIIFGKNAEFMSVGYRPFFKYSVEDLKKLITWAENLCDGFKVSVSKTKNYWDLRNAICEYVHSNISMVLQDKITEIMSESTT